jgi:hypothetical protein
MRHKMLIAFCSLAFALFTSPARADVLFTLSSPSNLSALTVGQKVEIDVSLSGLPSPNNVTDFIFNLNTKILFSSSLFQAIPDPTTASGLTAATTAGSVFFNSVQGPLQVANFQAQSSLAAGSANGNFSESPNPASGAIGLNGLYYSFMLMAKAAGSGSISFDPTPGANQYAANETSFNFAPLPTAGNLSFTITQTAVPEPRSIVLVVLSVAIFGCRNHPRKRPTA